MSTTVSEGRKAPDITLPDELGNPVSLKDLRGKTVVLYFYPRDDTPGCTTQACDLRDNWPDFDRDDLVVYGVSADSAESHQKFIRKHDLPFHLLVDKDRKLLTAFGAWGEKSMFGKIAMGIKRTTVIIDPDGTVRKIFRNVKAGQHIDLLRDELGL